MCYMNMGGLVVPCRWFDMTMHLRTETGMHKRSYAMVMGMYCFLGINKIENHLIGGYTFVTTAL